VVEAGDTPFMVSSKSVANPDDPRVGGAMNSTEYPTRAGAMMNASHQAPLRNMGSEKANSNISAPRNWAVSS